MPLSYIIFISLLLSIILFLSVSLYRKNTLLKKEDNKTEIISEICDVMENHKEVKEEKEMLKSVLDLDDISVYDVMNHRKNLFSIDISLPPQEIISRLKDCPFSRVPIYQDKPENIVGVIRVKHLLKEAVETQGDYNKIKIQSLMNKPWFIPDSTTLLQQLQLFRARREHFAIVVDEYGDLQGIVTLEDILEEIVGDINDETDIQSLDIIGIRRSNDKKSLIIDGQVPIRDLNRRYGWSLNDENAVTLAGYLIDATQSIPEQGQKFSFENFEFEILKRTKNQINSIKLTPLKNAESLSLNQSKFLPE